MVVRLSLILAFLAIAACGKGASPPPPSPLAFFTAQKAWCTVAKGGVTNDSDDQFDEVYLFSKDGALHTASAQLDSFNRLQWDENAMIKVKTKETAEFHADANTLYFKIGDGPERMAKYQIISQKQDGKSVKCFTLSFNNSTHCPCAASEAN